VFLTSGEGRETPTLLGPLERATSSLEIELTFYKGPSRVGVSHHSPEDGKRSNFRNLVYRNYLEFRMMDEVHKPMNPEG
jgi:hypothetical protein